MNPSFDWSKFTLRVPVKADAQKIYEAWATSAGLKSWFLSSCYFTAPQGILRNKNEFAQEGDHYKWFWFGYDDTVFEQRTVLEANGKDLFKFRFTDNNIVTVRITEQNGETLVVLEQENIAWDENPGSNLRVQCATGWTFYLTNLKSILEGGHDLRNKNAGLPNVINA